MLSLVLIKNSYSFVFLFVIVSNKLDLIQENRFTIYQENICQAKYCVAIVKMSLIRMMSLVWTSNIKLFVTGNQTVV